MGNLILKNWCKALILGWNAICVRCDNELMLKKLSQHEKTFLQSFNCPYSFRFYSSSSIRIYCAAILITVNMVFAIMLFHSHHLIELNQYGGWELELQGFYFLTAIVIFLQGSGKYAVRPS